MYEYIITVGCFDRLHYSHIRFVNYCRQYAHKVVVGLFDTELCRIMLNKLEVQAFTTRKKNLLHLVDEVFMVSQKQLERQLQR